MPFIGRCKTCNYLVFAESRAEVNLKLWHHYLKSHYGKAVPKFRTIRVSWDKYKLYLYYATHKQLKRFFWSNI